MLFRFSTDYICCLWWWWFEQIAQLANPVLFAGNSVSVSWTVSLWNWSKFRNVLYDAVQCVRVVCRRRVFENRRWGLHSLIAQDRESGWARRTWKIWCKSVFWQLLLKSFIYYYYCWSFSTCDETLLLLPWLNLHSACGHYLVWPLILMIVKPMHVLCCKYAAYSTARRFGTRCQIRCVIRPSSLNVLAWDLKTHLFARH